MDKVILDIISLLLTVVGIVSALTRFYTPKMIESYWGRNPFMEKRVAIDNKTTLIFLVVAIIGVLIQAFSIIFELELGRRHTTVTYMTILGAGIFSAFALAHFCADLGKRWAMKKFRKTLLTDYAKHLDFLNFMLEADTEYSTRYKEKRRIKDSGDSIRSANMDSAEKMIDDIDELLELKLGTFDRKIKLVKLNEIISPYYIKKNQD